MSGKNRADPPGALGNASETARMIASYRARASTRPEAICADPWADRLAGAEGHRLSERFDEAFPPMELWVAVRTRFIDDLVRRAIARGYPQVVLLGAGYDTRAARLAAPGVTFYEVDHPRTQAHKRRRLKDLPGYPEAAARYVPCDFERDEFVDRLREAGFRADRPALFVWEGVTLYLTAQAVQRTMRRVARGGHPTSLLVFDYFGKGVVARRNITAADHNAHDLLDSVGEPMRWGSNHPMPEIYGAGFRWVRLITFDEVCLDYTGTWVRERRFRFQGLALASVRPPEEPWA